MMISLNKLKEELFQNKKYVGIGFAIGAVATCALSCYKKRKCNKAAKKDNAAYRKGWKLYYWQSIGGRGQYVRLMFELAGIEWEEALKEARGKDWPEQKQIYEEVSKSTKNLYPYFAKPFIVHEPTKLLISQTPSIILFIGSMFNLIPDKDIDKAHANQIMLQTWDALSEAEMAYHPVDRHKSYKDQQKEARPIVDKWIKERLILHLNMLEAALSKNNNGQGWFFGEKLTYADVVVATFMRGFETSEKKYYDDYNQYPLLKAHRQRFEKHPRVKEFYQSDRVANGIDDNSFMG